MPIPESQLETWSSQGAVATAKRTHESIRNALEDKSSPLADKSFEIYLQGSYKNDTNIFGDSDVDVVVQLNSSFLDDTSGISETERSLYKSTFHSVPYGWKEFRLDILNALKGYYGSPDLSEGNKALKLRGGSGRLDADIVICLQYRKYLRFRSLSDQTYVEGISFYIPVENRWIVNFPKAHYDNGVKKNGDLGTRGLYKPAVRMFKNARTYLADKQLISEDLAPSYFLECFLYNVPDSTFGNDHQQTFVDVVNWLAKADTTQFICQNGQMRLFGDTREQWSPSHARQFLGKLGTMWDDW